MISSGDHRGGAHRDGALNLESPVRVEFSSRSIDARRDGLLQGGQRGDHLLDGRLTGATGASSSHLG